MGEGTRSHKEACPSPTCLHAPLPGSGGTDTEEEGSHSISRNALISQDGGKQEGGREGFHAGPGPGRGRWWSERGPFAHSQSERKGLTILNIPSLGFKYLKTLNVWLPFLLIL